METKIQNLEDELKVLKNEVQAVLLDIKEFLITGGGLGAGAALSSNGETAQAFTPPEAAPPQSGGDSTAQDEPALEEPEPVATDSGRDAADQTTLTFGEDPVDLGTDWSCRAADQAAPDSGESSGLEGADEGAPGSPAPDFPPSDTGAMRASEEVDLPMLAILTPWLSRAVATVGKDHAAKLVEIYDVARELPPRLKRAILLLADLQGDCATGKPSGDALMREAITLLIELDSLLLRHRTGTLESAVLSLLQDRMTASRKTRSRKASNG